MNDNTKQHVSDLSLGEQVFIGVTGGLAGVCFAAPLGFVWRAWGWW